jgi:steroid delta-isomerase-like uncharacterized protein
MSAEENKAVVRRLWEEVWNRADLAVADAIFEDAYAAHEKAFVPVIRAAFPDSHHTVDDLIAEGDKVVTRFTWSGTHRGEFEGIPPSGRSISVGGIWIHRLEGGRIVEGRDWGLIDWMSLLRQLDALPDPL